MKITHIFTGIIIYFLVIHNVQGQAPVINRISQTHGTVNETITLQGRGFGSNANDLAVFFGGAAASSVTWISDTELRAVVPPGATTGSVSVINLSNGLTAYSREVFTLSYDGYEFDKNKLEPPVALDTEGNELYSFCVCDFNLDGRNDIVSTHTTRKATVLQNSTVNTDGFTFVRPPAEDVEAEETRWVRCGDINGDGKPDLVFTFSNLSSDKNRVAVYKNITDLSTSDRFIEFEDDNEATVFAIEGDQGGRTVIRDLDGDGRPELVVADLNGRGGVSIFRNNSTPTTISFDTDPVLPFKQLEVPAVGVAGVDVGDLNNDGLPDLVASNGTKEVLAFVNASTPGNITFSSHITATSDGIQNLKLGDLDGDGQLDIAVSSGKYLGVLRNTTDSTEVGFAREAKFNPSPPNNNISYIGLDLADMDGNGRLDVVLANENTFPKLVSVILNNSTPGALDLNQSTKLQTGRNRTARAADFNGDGKPDLAYTHITDDQIVIQLNRNCIQPVLEPTDGLGVCDVLPYQLNATQGIGLDYRWEVSDDGTNFSPVADAVDTDTYTTAQEKFYRVQVGSSHLNWECPARTSNVVKVVRPDGFVPERPIIVGPNPSTPYCFGEEVTIEAENINAEFIWTDPQGNVIPDASTNVLTISEITAAQAGEYSVYVQASPEQGGCVSDVATSTILVSEPPALQITSDRPPVLFTGDSRIILSVVATEDHTYAWQRDGQPVVDATGTSLTVSEAGNYTAVVTNSIGCTRASAAFTVAAAETTIPTEVCLRAPAEYRVAPDSLNGAPIRYRWTFGVGSAQEGNAPEYRYAQAGNFTITVAVLAADGTVTDQREQPIVVHDLPELALTTEGKRHLCPGETVMLVGSEGFDSYAWSTGETSASLVVAEAGTYTLTVTTDEGCTLSERITVEDVPNPEAIITADADRVGLGDTLPLTASGGTSYRWSPSTGLSDTTIANPVARPLVTTTYQCVVGTDDGCSVTAEYTIYVDRSLEVVPRKIFSPNQDGQNDTWFIEKMELYPDCQLTLFDRQGVRVFERDNYTNDNPWDGTHQGQIVPAGVYFYLINCGDEAGQQTGSVTVVR